MNPTIAQYLDVSGFSERRARRLVDGLRVLQSIASQTDRPITYSEFVERVQPGLHPQNAGAILSDVADFCNDQGWPNVTCLVVSKTTGECSPGFRRTSDLDPDAARNDAWLKYAAYKDGPLVDR